MEFDVTCLRQPIKAFINHQSPTIHGDGSQSRDFTYIDNVIQANELAAVVADKNAINQVYNIACGEQSFLKDLVGHLKDLLAEFDPYIKEIQVQNGPERLRAAEPSLPEPPALLRFGVQTRRF